MPLDETATDPVVDSETDSTVEAVDTGSDTDAGDVHTETNGEPAAVPPDDGEAHIKWLQDNSDKIPTEKIAFLDRKFQPDYTSKLNQLNLLKDNFEGNAAKIAANVGIQLPEGKTAYDLMMENDGKAFFEAIDNTVRNNLKPVLDQVEAGRMNENLRKQIGVAAQNFPLFKENYAEAIQMVDSNSDMTTMGMDQGGRALPYVLDYAASKIALAKKDAIIADLTGKLDKARVASKGGATTKATSGGPAPAPAAPHSGNIKSAIRAAAEKAMAELETR